MGMIYYSKRTQNKVGKGKRHMSKALREPVQALKSSNAVIQNAVNALAVT